MELNEYQRLAKETDQRQSNEDDISKVIPLLGLFGEIGSVAAEHKKRLRDGKSYFAFKDKLKDELGDVLWYVATIAGDIDVTLDDVAINNLDKTKERWTESENFAPKSLFDESFPKGEQFPREMVVEFKTNSSGKIQMLVEGQELGDPLSDNAYEDDGYRFHDIFHLAFMARLGWSPVLRKLLKCKRKSNPIVDNVEDGARAGIVEEAISIIVYEQAKNHNFFEGVDVIDHELLKTIKGMVQNLEVRNITSSLWEDAILKAYSIYRELRVSNGGKVKVDLIKKTIDFVP